MGGSWLSDYINYIEFDLYYCEDGVSYDENNTKCVNFKKITDFIGENNSLDFALYYPFVQFQPTNKANPIIVVYTQYFYHLSKFSNKIERIFLQENVLTDDSGWILSRESNNSFWGLNSIQSDNYFTGKENDLMNEGSNSRGYSFNIYLEPGIIHYKRYYKKIYTILSDFFPIAYILFLLMKNITKLLKKVEINQKLVELLFENLKEKPNIFEENLQKLKIQNNQITQPRMSNKSVKRHKLSVEFQYMKEKGIHHSSFTSNKESINKKSEGDCSVNMSIMPKNKSKKMNIKLSNQHKKYRNNTSNQFLVVQDKFKKEFNYPQFASNIKINNQPINNKKEFIKQKLFPYKYYLCSVFIRNLDISQKHYFISSRFAKTYIFLCQLIDITTYLLLQREFNALKTIFNEKSLNIIEKNKKININSNTFIEDISDCIGEQKFHILAQGNK
jgi:hypothetical protein